MNSAAAPAALPPSSPLFDAVVRKDCQGLLKLYAGHARGAVVSYLSMKTRWSTGYSQPPSPESYRTGKFLDDLNSGRSFDMIFFCALDRIPMLI